MESFFIFQLIFSNLFWFGLDVVIYVFLFFYLNSFVHNLYHISKLTMKKTHPFLKYVWKKLSDITATGRMGWGLLSLRKPSSNKKKDNFRYFSAHCSPVWGSPQTLCFLFVLQTFPLLCFIFRIMKHLIIDGTFHVMILQFSWNTFFKKN